MESSHVDSLSKVLEYKNKKNKKDGESIAKLKKLFFNNDF
jgi:hypothetical protein